MTDKPLNVRIATPADEDEVFRLFCLAHEENGIGEINEERVRQHLTHATRQRGGVIGIIDGPDGLEGLLFMILSQRWYSDKWFWEELCNFVHPDHRKTTHAKNLIEFGKWFAEEMKMPLFIGILSSERVAAKIRLYERQLTPAGALFHHNLN